MYSQHFGFTKAPFKITPDPEFFFAGGNRGAVLEALIYAVSRGEGIVKVVGEVGSGKTMLCRMLERELPENCEIVYLANPRLSPDEILQAIAFELKVPVGASANRLEVMHALQEYLITKHADQRRVAVFVEEAQGMPIDTLEEIRMLSNLETTRDKLLQIVLFGQPELNAKLDRHEIRQLKERITFAFELAPFKPAQIGDYVNTRVRASGYRGSQLFTDGAIRALSRYSRGLLRRINILADKALLAAFSHHDLTVKPRHVRMAARDSEFDARRRPRAVWVGAAVMGLLAFAGAWYTWAPMDGVIAIEKAAAVPPPAVVPDQALPGAARAPAAAQPRVPEDTGARYEDLTAISTTLADHVPAAADEVRRDPTLPAGLLAIESLGPDVRPYLRIEALRSQLAGDLR